jgi:hypothetical protein
MLPTQNPTYTEILRHWCRFIFNAKDTSEGIYYAIIEDLTEKLDDLEIKEWPDFELVEFDFLVEWELGVLSSSDVYEIIKKWDISQVTKKKLTRHLTDFMFKYEDAAEYIKATMVTIEEKAIPEYEKYLKAMVNFFKKAAECDSHQESIAWLQITEKDNVIKNSVENLTLNQVIRQLDNYVVGYAKRSYSVGDNVVCFETGSDGAKDYHWVVGLKSYIQVIKAMFDVTTHIKETDVLKDKIKDYVI